MKREDFLLENLTFYVSGFTLRWLDGVSYLGLRPKGLKVAFVKHKKSSTFAQSTKTYYHLAECGNTGLNWPLTQGNVKNET